MSTSASPSAVLNASNQSKLSHTLSKILRHSASSLGLSLDSRGYASVDALLALPTIQRLSFVNLQTIQQVVRDCPKQRFGLLKPSEGEGEWKIRANQGHNVELAAKFNLDASASMTPITLADADTGRLPRFCMHGTSLAAFNVILASGGLHPMQRTHIHFASEDFGSAAMISGMRKDSQVLIHLDLAHVLRWTAQHQPKMHLDFFQSANAVILTAGVRKFGNLLPTFLFARVETVERQGGAFLRKEMQWTRPTESQWMEKFAPNRANASASSATVAPADAASSNLIQLERPAPRESRWGPPATSRPPPGWIVPPRLAHIVNGAPSTASASTAAAQTAVSKVKQQQFEYLVVLDFEATCDEQSGSGARFGPQEVIEFPMFLVSLSTGETVDVFHKYVTPVLHPRLTPFCTSLTGITQEMVSSSSGAESFEAVWKQAQAFLAQHGLTTEDGQMMLKPFAFLTCGDWDLKTMLGQQLQNTYSSRTLPTPWRSWINIKQSFNNFYKPHQAARGMTDMLRQLNLRVEGRHHSGVDDSRNIAAITKRMLADGHVFAYTTLEKRKPQAHPSHPNGAADSTTSMEATSVPAAASAVPRNSALASALNRNQGQPRNQSAVN